MKTRNLFSVCVICLVLATGTTVLAQKGRPDGPRPGGRDQGGPPALPDSTQIVQIVDELAQKLSLSADQKQQVAELHFAHFGEARALMGNAAGDRSAHRQKMEALRTEFDNEVNALLSDKQRAKFAEFQKNRRPRPER